MRRISRNTTAGMIAGLVLAVGFTGFPTIPPSWADPPGEHGRGHDRDRDDDHGRGDEHGRGREQAEHHERHFQDRDRDRVHAYFADYEREGHCPPGLARKGNGCLPPGQARHWVVGAPLPPEAVVYELPPSLVVQLTPPPIGYKYVRVASDILMIAAGTGMVAEAIEDLGR